MYIMYVMCLYQARSLKSIEWTETDDGCQYEAMEGNSHLTNPRRSPLDLSAHTPTGTASSVGILTVIRLPTESDVISSNVQNKCAAMRSPQSWMWTLSRSPSSSSASRSAAPASSISAAESNDDYDIKDESPANAVGASDDSLLWSSADFCESIRLNTTDNSDPNNGTETPQEEGHHSKWTRALIQSLQLNKRAALSLATSAIEGGLGVDYAHRPVFFLSQETVSVL